MSRLLGIEADIIVMHPYDRWGLSKMTADQDDLYWKDAARRFSAYRNVWWSFANEYDLLREKTIADWERYAEIVCREDPYQHLRSIHNCHTLYDYSRHLGHALLHPAAARCDAGGDDQCVAGAVSETHHHR